MQNLANNICIYVNKFMCGYSIQYEERKTRKDKYKVISVDNGHEPSFIKKDIKLIVFLVLT